LARRLRASEAVRRRGSLAPGGFVDGGKRRQRAECRIDLSTDTLWQSVFPTRVWQDERGVHAARLFRFSRFAAEHSRARRHKRFFDAKADVEFGGARRWPRLD